jgi:hypothetical protein
MALLALLCQGVSDCPAKTQYQKFETNTQILPEKELHGLSPNFHIYLSVSDLYILMIGLAYLLQENMGIYKSLTDT